MEETDLPLPVVFELKQISADDQGLAHYKSHAVYGAHPLKGEAEFEVKITKLAGRVPGFSAGVVFTSKHEKNELCIFKGEVSIHPTISGKWLYSTLGCGESQWSTYGQTDRRGLRVGDRVGLILSKDGVLEFTVNGESRGIAAENVYIYSP